MTDIVHELRQQTFAATALIEQLRTLIGDDDEMQATAIEGETNLHEAIDAAVKRLAEIELLVSGVKDAQTHLKDRADRLSRQSDAIRTAITVAMEAAEMKKLELPIATVTCKATPPKVEIIDESLIPSQFWKQPEPTVSKSEIAKALKDKIDVPGALLSNGGTTIQVRFS